MPHLFNQKPGVFKDSLWSPYGSPNVDLKQIDCQIFSPAKMSLLGTGRKLGSVAMVSHV